MVGSSSSRSGAVAAGALLLVAGPAVAVAVAVGADVDTLSSLLQAPPPSAVTSATPTSVVRSF
jgi:hypothetical protein